jgi:hypothetical protein
MIMATETSINNRFESPRRQRTKSISSIGLVPASGESSPTSVLVDVTAVSPVGVSELKRIQGYSNQLLLPEAMIYGNDLIKVWSIDDECMVGDGSQSTMIQYQEEPTYNKATFDPVRPESQDEKTKDSKTVTTKPISNTEEQIDESNSMDVDDLFFALSPTVNSLSPRLSPAPLSPPATISLPQLFTPLSPLPTSDCTCKSSGNTNTIVLENLSADQEILAPPLSITKPSKGHKRRHRRNQSHFDFQFK